MRNRRLPITAARPLRPRPPAAAGTLASLSAEAHNLRCYALRLERLLRQAEGMSETELAGLRAEYGLPVGGGSW